MTIKEKMMKAWAQDLEVVVYFDECSELTGYIDDFSGREAAIKYAECGIRPIPFRDITDIRFVGEREVEEFGPWSMLIRVAKINDLRVSVVTKHSAMPEAKTDVGKFVEINCNDEYSLLAREEQGDKVSIYHNIIISMTFLRDEPESSTNDVSKQRWKWLRFKTPLCEDVLCIPDQDGKRGQRLAIRASATDAQIAVIEAAPEMLDALETLVKISTFSRIQSGTVNADTITAKFNPDGWRIITDAIAKALGGDSE